jgi:hypothetical protein
MQHRWAQVAASEFSQSRPRAERLQMPLPSLTEGIMNSSSFLRLPLLTNRERLNGQRRMEVPSSELGAGP